MPSMDADNGSQRAQNCESAPAPLGVDIPPPPPHFVPRKRQVVRAADDPSTIPPPPPHFAPRKRQAVTAADEPSTPPPPPHFAPRKRQAVSAADEVKGSFSRKRICVGNFLCLCCSPPTRSKWQTKFLEMPSDAMAKPIGASASNELLKVEVVQAIGPYVDTHVHLDEVLQTIRRHQVAPTLHKQVSDFSSEELDAWRVLGWAKNPVDKAAASEAAAATSSSVSASQPSESGLPANEIWSCDWDQLSEEQRQAAVDLGYDSPSWNRNKWLLPRKTRWQALDDTVQRCLLRLGETPSSWDNWNGIGASAESSSSGTRLDCNDMRTWNVLTLKEQQAALSLGFTSATFNCQEMANLHESVDILCGPLFDGCVTQGCDAGSIDPARKLAAWHPKVYASFGCHPKNAWSYNRDMEAKLLESMEVCDASGKRKALAWGEFGLDYSHPMYGRDGANRRQQKEVFARQLGLAVDRGYPLVVHSRGADHDTLRIFRKFIPRDWPVHVHSFRGSLPFMEALISGWTRAYIGISGIITMQDFEAQAIARACPLERMVLETDAPYLPLANSHFSHPGTIPQIINKVAELQGITAEKVSQQVRENARNIYGI